MLRMACAIIQQDEVTVGELHAMAADAVGAQQASDLLKQAAQCLLPESPAPVGQPDDIADQSERPVGEPSPAVGQSERAADEPDQIADEPLSERRPP